MTTLIEAARQALEALEEIVKWYGVRDKNNVLMFPHNQNPEIKEAIETIASLRQALSEAQLSVNENSYAIEQAQEPKCNPHPKAPHGFDRNASHGLDRHVCECESWDAYDAGIEEGMKRERALWEKAENSKELGLDYEPVQAEQEPVARSLKDSVFLVLEGFTLPHDVRKILETAYYTTPQAQQAEKQVAWQDTRKTWVDVPLKNVLKENT
jgi:hypothetical protein